MAKRLGLGIMAAVLIAASGVAMRAPREERTSGPLQPVLSGAQVDGGTLALLGRACLNCHSEETKQPWYGRLPPGSWIIERDIRAARSHMNLSRWQDYSADEKQSLLSAMGVAARARVMPPGRYTLLHPEARLSDGDRDRIYRWTKSERQRLSGRPSLPPRQSRVELESQDAQRNELP
jgi:hypothetical protein